jgi:signal transduction histidine kinase
MMEPRPGGWESLANNPSPGHPHVLQVPGTMIPGPADQLRPVTPAQREKSLPTLLVVDDEPEVLQSVSHLLRMKYRVLTRPNGSEALEVLRTGEDVQVIMSDQRMPGMTGVELLRKANEVRPETTRLLFTAHADIHTVIDAINQGHIFRYVAKPWNPDELEAIVHQAVEHHNLIVEKNRLVGELQSINAKLTEANRLKGAFIEVASHELNTPVTVVLGMTELWKMSQSAAASPAERQWVDRIGSAANRLARTVERMLKLVRAGDFSQALEQETIDIGTLVHRMVDEVAPYLERRKQSVVVDLEPELGLMEADPFKMADVLINLLANAIKFTPDGGTIRVQVGSELAGDWISIRVTDQGMGVPSAEQQYLFEPFFTGFDTMRHSSGDYQYGKRGIGLGLWLVKTFIELHGGKVEASSAAGHGSTFSCLIPRSQTNRPVRR